MEHKKESVEEVLARIFGAPAQKGSLVTRPSHDAPACVMTDNQKAIAVSVTRLWLTLADLALTITGQLVMTEAMNPEAAKKIIDTADYLLDRLSDGESTAAQELRTLRSNAMRVGPLPPEVKKKCLSTLNTILDMMKPFTPLVNAVARYCLKLQSAELQIERTFDAISDYEFAREIRTELSLLG